jgi:hypothetical protein
MTSDPVPAGDTAVISVEETPEKLVAAVPPNRTAVAPLRLVPVMVTRVAPELGPEVGLNDLIVGALTVEVVKVKSVAEDAVPELVVTETGTDPVPAGLMAVIWVVEFTVKLVAAVLPNVTAITPLKFVPVRTTEVPPPAGPEVGLNELIVGAPTVEVVKVKSVAEDAVPELVVTETGTDPVPAGLIAVIWVVEFTVKLVAAVLPNVTAVTPLKFVPVRTTEVPPPAGPEAGLNELMTGALDPPREAARKSIEDAGGVLPS